jgi:hypothetical protein
MCKQAHGLHLQPHLLAEPIERKSHDVVKAALNAFNKATTPTLDTICTFSAEGGAKKSLGSNQSNLSKLPILRWTV